MLAHRGRSRACVRRGASRPHPGAVPAEAQITATINARPRTEADRDVYVYVEANLRRFHTRRLESLNSLQPGRLLRRKNLYLFRSKNIIQASDLVLSNGDNFYLRIIEPIGRDAKRHNDDFAQAYGSVVNRFTKEFTEGFCTTDGAID